MALAANEQEIAALSIRHPRNHPMIALARVRRSLLLDRAGNQSEAMIEARTAQDTQLARNDVHDSLRAKSERILAALKSKQGTATNLARVRRVKTGS
jgi:hypothetical protein